MGKYKSKIVIFFILINICVFIAGAYAAKDNIIYSYGDGNGNAYILSGSGKKTIEYKPLKPENSSSGTYDGGKYVKKNISNKQYGIIVLKIDKAVKNKKIHIKNRIKTSGMITIVKGKSKSVYILKPNSKELIDLENALKKTI